MSPLGKFVGLANALESVWTFYTVLSGFSVGLFAYDFPPFLQPAPWWLVPAILLQIVFATILLGVAYGCLVGSQFAFPLGALVSLGMLLSFILMFGIVPLDYLSVAVVLSLLAAVGNIFALRVSPTPPKLLGRSREVGVNPTEYATRRPKVASTAKRTRLHSIWGGVTFRIHFRFCNRR